MSATQLPLKELTIRGIILGALITLVFTASNVYLGLKVGMTFASSIPAAVISMAVLRAFRDSNILENNIVQTQASAAGTLSAIIFVLPALIMMGYWQNFPLIQTALICICGGILGVVFTVPLRRALVVNSDLPYPEGVAAAEILSVGHDTNDDATDISKSNKGSGFKEILFGGLLAGAFSIATNGLRIASDSFSYWFSFGKTIFQLPVGFSFALVGAGYLVGITGGIAMLFGVFLSWGIAVPWLTTITPMPADTSIADFAVGLWVSKVRLIGAGMIAVAAIWTLITLLKPMLEGMRISIQALRSGSDHHDGTNKDMDLAPNTLLKITLVTIALLVVTFYTFVADSGMDAHIAWTIIIVSTLISFVIGFLIAAACGYMAGLVGSSASPISGIAVIAVLVTSLVFIGIGSLFNVIESDQQKQFFTAVAIFCSSVIVAIGAISNDNLQDLKTGWLVHATPWRQQIALIIGCIVGAIAIPPVLELLYNAYGFLGSLPRADMDPGQALTAPQASLMITIAQGLFNSTLDWTFIYIGVAAGIGCIIFDIVLGRIWGVRMPPLAVAMGLYLPASVATAIFIGSLISWSTKRKIKAKTAADQVEARLEHSNRKGTLFASGMIVGESLVGVALAMIIVVSVSSGGSDAPLAIVSGDFAATASVIGILAFIAMCIFFARRTLSKT